MALSMNKSPKGESKPSFLKKGVEAQEVLANEEAKAELRKEQSGKLWRFFISGDEVGDDVRITFLDGNLTEDGTLDVPMWHEHTVMWNGQWQNLVAVSEEDGPDPISEHTGKDPAFVFGLTVIDHREFKGKDGKVYKDRKKLFVGKRKTLGYLTKIAQKRGGLVGCTFDVSRSSTDDANVGNMYEFVAKHDLAELAEEYGEETATPANFEEELTYHGREKYLEMGFGSKPSVGGAKPSKDFSKEL